MPKLVGNRNSQSLFRQVILAHSSNFRLCSLVIKYFGCFAPPCLLCQRANAPLGSPVSYATADDAWFFMLLATNMATLGDTAIRLSVRLSLSVTRL